jgi:Rha family phage regulatory protein
MTQTSTSQKPELQTLIPIVTIKEGRVVANSRDVAEAFGKQHAHVLRAIDDLDCSPQFRASNFGLTVVREKVGATFRELRAFDLTRDGFVFLVMGFTGREAARFKEAYIAAFNAMEDELRRMGVPLPHEDEGLQMFGLAPRLADLALRSVSIAERLAGPEAGLRMWSYHKLPSLKRHTVQALAGTARDDGHGCLAHLLRFAAGPQVSVGSRLDTALHDTVAARAVRSFGILAEAPGRPGFVAVADRHPFLEQVFAETQWIGAWAGALASLPGAQRSGRKLTFDGKQSTAVLLPRDLILQQRYPRAQ